MMKRELNGLFDTLLNTSECFGVGLVDSNGLIIHSAGEHAGYRIAELGAALVAASGNALEQLSSTFGESFEEQFIIGSRHHYYLLWLKRRYLLYAIAPQGASSGRIRTSLHTTRQRLGTMLTGDGLLTPANDGLEQPRQFSKIPSRLR